MSKEKSGLLYFRCQILDWKADRMGRVRSKSKIEREIKNE